MRKRFDLITERFQRYGGMAVTQPRNDGIEALAAETEALGFDGPVLTNSQNQSPDTYAALALATWL